MNKKILAVVLLIAAVAVVLFLKREKTASAAPTEAPSQVSALPKLLDLGAGKCASCKAMTPILEELAATFSGQMEVEYIDVWETEGASEQYDINLIPAQIFFDAQGRELFRHQGFISRKDILKKWKELGYVFEDEGNVKSGLMESVTHAMQGTPSVALWAALLWGILSIILSPCHLAAIPLIVGVIGGQQKQSVSRALITSILFALGILVTIAFIGAVTAWAGRMIGDIGQVGSWLVALIFFVVGLNLMGVVPLGWKPPEHAGEKRSGFFAAFMLGLIFGIALGPCSFAYMAPLLGISLKLGAAQPVYAGSLLLMFGLGHCGVIAFAGVSAGWVQKYRDWNMESHGALRLKRICGFLVLLGGLYLIYTAR